MQFFTFYSNGPNSLIRRITTTELISVLETETIFLYAVKWSDTHLRSMHCKSILYFYQLHGFFVIFVFDYLFAKLKSYYYLDSNQCSFWWFLQPLPLPRWKWALLERLFFTPYFKPGRLLWLYLIQYTKYSKNVQKYLTYLFVFLADYFLDNFKKCNSKRSGP